MRELMRHTKLLYWYLDNISLATRTRTSLVKAKLKTTLMYPVNVVKSDYRVKPKGQNSYSVYSISHK
jgi:hypothetical protein